MSLAAHSDTAMRYSESNPCPVCERGSKGCSLTKDGQQFCRGGAVDAAAWTDLLKGRTDGTGFYHFRRTSDTRNLNGRPALNGKPHNDPKPVLKRTPRPKLNAKPGEPQTWREQAEKFNREGNPAAIAASLGLPAEAFTLRAQCLLLGYTDHGAKAGDGEWVGAVTFPMVNGQREPTGILKRLDLHIGGENKKTMPGGEPGKTLGLILGLEWDSRPGPLLIVEGGSDTVALAICGLAAIGRPSNVIGAELLAELLADFPADRAIVVVGENDRKPNGQWPGKEGVDAVAPKLAASLGRPVLAAYPPPEHKDCRDWVKELLAGQAELDLAAAGETIRRHVEETAAAPIDSPPPDTTPAAPRFTFIDSAAFATGDFRPQWHVKRMLVKGQPAVIAGPSKSLKTGLAIDLAISLAAGGNFLGEFPANRCRVAVVSGESGEHTIQETARRICTAREIDLAGLSDSLSWCFSLPTFSDAESMLQFASELAKLKADVVIIDPLYLTLGAIDPRNMFEMGAALRGVASILLKGGSTPVLLHHANGRLETGKPMELANLAYSGLEQFARQWMLLNRRTAYTGDGSHDLWLSAGGSAGHGGIWAVNVAEGIVGEDFGGRTWSTTVRNLGEFVEEKQNEQAIGRHQKARAKVAMERDAILLAIDAEASMGRDGATMRRVKERTGYGTAKAKELIAEMIEEGDIEPVDFVQTTGNGATSKLKGWKRLETERREAS